MTPTGITCSATLAGHTIVLDKVPHTSTGHIGMRGMDLVSRYDTKEGRTRWLTRFEVNAAWAKPAEKQAPASSVVPFKLDIPMQVLHMWRFAAQDKGCYNLTSIAIERDDDKLVAIATDGHRLLTFSWTPEATDDLTVLPKNKPLLLSSDDCKRLVKLARKRPKQTRDAPVALHLEPGKTVEANMPHGVLYIETIDASFPDWRQILPTPATSSAPDFLCLNADYLADFGRWVTDCTGEKQPRVMLTMATATRDLGPMQWESPLVSDAVYILMPCRLP